MESKFRKYFISALSVLLILSNFSFATTLMLCSMDMDTSVCACSHKSAGDTRTPSIEKVKKSCCESETVELSNSNILLAIKNDLNNNSLVIINTINNEDDDYFFNSKSSHYSINKVSYYLPISDIPIINSSLLI